MLKNKKSVKITVAAIQVVTSPQLLQSGNCLIICSLALSEKPHVQISPYFLHVLHVVVLAPSQTAMLCTSGFEDDVTLSYNRANRSEWKTTRVFRSVRQVAVTGAKSAVSDCISFFWVRRTHWALDAAAATADGKSVSVVVCHHSAGGGNQHHVQMQTAKCMTVVCNASDSCVVLRVPAIARDPGLPQMFQFHNLLVLYFKWAWTSFFWVRSRNYCILPYSNSALRLRFLSALFCVQFCYLLIACRDVICDMSTVDTRQSTPTPGPLNLFFARRHWLAIGQFGLSTVTSSWQNRTLLRLLTF